MAPLVLVVNPGSASRKYALYERDECRVRLHFEFVGEQIVCNYQTAGSTRELKLPIKQLSQAAEYVVPVLQDNGGLAPGEVVKALGVRVVAPSSQFAQRRKLDNEAIAELERIHALAPLHISALIQELRSLKEQFPDTPVFGVSDSAFHATKPVQARYYGLPIDDANRFDIKRFGYHGLSAASAVAKLKQADQLPDKLILCHLGSGVSVSAVQGGRSLDTTMGYTPLEGPVMATRAGSIDPIAVRALRQGLGLSESDMQAYLSSQSGLLGLSGKSSDIRELLKLEAGGNRAAALALQFYVYNLQKAIGQMAAVLGGADGLVFTGTVGVRSVPIRQRIIHGLGFLKLHLDPRLNQQEPGQEPVRRISESRTSRPILVVQVDEEAEIARQVR